MSQTSPQPIDIIGGYIERRLFIAGNQGQIRPDDQQVMLNLAVANIGLRRFDEALSLLDRAAATPKAPLFEIALHKGIAYNHLNHIQDALDLLAAIEPIAIISLGAVFGLIVLSILLPLYDVMGTMGKAY